MAAQQRGPTFRLIQNCHPFPAANRLGLFDRCGRTHIPNPIHRADRNDVRLGIFKHPRRLTGRQNLRRPNLVGAKLQNPQPRGFARRFPIHAQAGMTIFGNGEFRFVRRHGIQPRRRRHERGSRVFSANRFRQGVIVREISQVIKNFTARAGLIARDFDLPGDFVRFPFFTDVGGAESRPKMPALGDSVAPTS